MAISTDITLPKRIAPVFPKCCIVCHAPPDSSTKIAKNAQHWLLTFFLPAMYLFGWSRTEIPICKECKPRFYLQRWGRTAICWAIVIGVALAAWPYFAGWSRLTQKLALLALAGLAITPYAVFELMWPRIFTVTAEGDKVTYEFASELYARRFYLLNCQHILKSDIEYVGLNDA